MNQKTGKLLIRYARSKNMKTAEFKELKRWWAGLPWPERAAERKRLLTELGTKTPQAA